MDCLIVIKIDVWPRASSFVVYSVILDHERRWIDVEQ